MKKPVYLDYAATTPVDPRVKAVMLPFLNAGGMFGNAASRSHCFGREAEKAVEKARGEVADLINADSQEIVWTSGATESDNLAIKGAAYFHSGRGKHIVTSAIEHKAVIDSCKYLETQGFEVTYIVPGKDGIITSEMVKESLRDDTVLLSLMHVNNELGTITDIESIGEITREQNVLFHVDAAQSAARLPIDVKSIQADFISISGHKMYAPKGVGALYIRRNPRARLFAQMHGGGHEGGIRSGTVPTHQVAGMGEAARLAAKQRHADSAHAEKLTELLLKSLEQIEQVSLNGDRSRCVPGIVNACFACAESESMMMSMDDVAISSGSACTSSDLDPSHVLLAIGIGEESAFSSLRFSMGRFSTEKDIDYASRRVRSSLNELRALSPLWEETDYKTGRAERRSAALNEQTS